jgi:hypothetical protein
VSGISSGLGVVIRQLSEQAVAEGSDPGVVIVAEKADLYGESDFCLIQVFFAGHGLVHETDEGVEAGGPLFTFEMKDMIQGLVAEGARADVVGQSVAG